VKAQIASEGAVYMTVPKQKLKGDNKWRSTVKPNGVPSSAKPSFGNNFGLGSNFGK